MSFFMDFMELFPTIEESLMSRNKKKIRVSPWRKDSRKSKISVITAGFEPKSSSESFNTPNAKMILVRSAGGPRKKLESDSSNDSLSSTHIVKPIKKKKKVYKRRFTSKELRDAHNAVIKGHNQSQTHHISNVSRGTVQNRLRSGNWAEVKFGRPRTLTPGQERELYVYAIDCTRGGQNLAERELKEAARYILKADDPNAVMSSTFPSKKWVDGFLERHKKLVRRTAQELGCAAANVRNEDITKFFITCNEDLEDIETGICKDFSRIHAVDEFGVHMNGGKAPKIFSLRGTKNAHTKAIGPDR